MVVYIIILLKISVNQHEIMTKKINNMLHVHVHDFDSLTYADLHFCYLFQKQLGTYPWLYIHTLSVTIWQNNQNKKHMDKSCLVESS